MSNITIPFNANGQYRVEKAGLYRIVAENYKLISWEVDGIYFPAEADVIVKGGHVAFINCGSGSRMGVQLRFTEMKSRAALVPTVTADDLMSDEERADSEYVTLIKGLQEQVKAQARRGDRITIEAPNSYGVIQDLIVQLRALNWTHSIAGVNATGAVTVHFYRRA